MPSDHAETARRMRRLELPVIPGLSMTPLLRGGGRRAKAMPRLATATVEIYYELNLWMHGARTLPVEITKWRERVPGRISELFSRQNHPFADRSDAEDIELSTVRGHERVDHRGA